MFDSGWPIVILLALSVAFGLVAVGLYLRYAETDPAAGVWVGAMCVAAAIPGGVAALQLVWAQDLGVDLLRWIAATLVVCALWLGLVRLAGWLWFGVRRRRARR